MGVVRLIPQYNDDAEVERFLDVLASLYVNAIIADNDLQSSQPD
jgi:NifB/MoaA-like Fe-S oxidoreductase